MAFKLNVGSIKLIPSTGGVFEVSVNGQSVYSKKATGEFPDEEALVRKIKSLL
ncbi:MAG: SelT/SelW/SelH family protein [Verrucomicrobia bacterium]|nr:MAG: SelT/SelW/SelH family protein [Verrucomicrobiota bacterium]